MRCESRVNKNLNEARAVHVKSSDGADDEYLGVSPVRGVATGKAHARMIESVN